MTARRGNAHACIITMSLSPAAVRRAASSRRVFRKTRSEKCCCSKRSDPQPIPETVLNAEKATNVLLESPYILMYPTRRNYDGSEFYSLAGRIMAAARQSI